MSKLSSLWRSVTGPAEPPSEEQLQHYDQQRAVLLKRASLSVKQVQLDSCHIEGEDVGKSTRLIGDGQDSNQLLHSFEIILEHGLTGGVLSFAGKATFWPLVAKISHKEAVQYLSRLQNVTSTAGRCRAWLRLAANENSLQSYFLVLCSDKDLLRERYEPHAFLLDDDKTAVLCNLLNGLSTISFNLTVDDPALEFEPTAAALPADKLRLTALQMQSASDASAEKEKGQLAARKADQTLLQHLQGQQQREEDTRRQKEEAASAQERLAEERRERELSNHKQVDLERKLAAEQELRLQQERLLSQQREQLERLRADATSAEEQQQLVTAEHSPSTRLAAAPAATAVPKTTGSPTAAGRVAEGRQAQHELPGGVSGGAGQHVVESRLPVTEKDAKPQAQPAHPPAHDPATEPNPHPRFSSVRMDESNDELVKKKKRAKSKSGARIGAVASSTLPGQDKQEEGEDGKDTAKEQPTPPALAEVKHRPSTADQASDESLADHAVAGAEAKVSPSVAETEPAPNSLETSAGDTTGTADVSEMCTGTGEYQDSRLVSTSVPKQDVTTGTSDTTDEAPLSADPSIVAEEVSADGRFDPAVAPSGQDAVPHGMDTPITAAPDPDAGTGLAFANTPSPDRPTQPAASEDGPAVQDLLAEVKLPTSGTEDEDAMEGHAVEGPAVEGHAVEGHAVEGLSQALPGAEHVPAELSHAAAGDRLDTDPVGDLAELAMASTEDTLDTEEREQKQQQQQQQEDYDSYLATLMRGRIDSPASADTSSDEEEDEDRVGELGKVTSKGHMWLEASIRSEVLADLAHTEGSAVQHIPSHGRSSLSASQAALSTTYGSYVVVGGTAGGPDRAAAGPSARRHADTSNTATASPLTVPVTSAAVRERGADTDEYTSSDAASRGSSSDSGPEGEEGGGESSSTEDERAFSQGTPDSATAQRTADAHSSVVKHPHGVAGRDPASSFTNSMSPPVRVPLGNGQHQWQGLAETNVLTSAEGQTEDDAFVMLSLVDVNDDHFAQPEAVGEHATVADLEVAIERLKQRVRTGAGEDKEELVTEIVELRLRLLQLVESTDTAEEQKIILGHRFVRKSKKPGSKSTCDRCGAIIWRMLQPWYRCAECYYNSHAKCLGDISRKCVREVAERGAKMRSFITEICPERGLGEQQYMCFECHRRITFSQRRNHLEARLCDYTGKYYCPFCHWNDLAVIPARIVHNWDFEPRKVCRSSLELLALMAKRACLSVGDVNSMLFNYVADLSTVKQVRQEILIMKEYFVQCPQAKNDMLLRKLENRQHYVETSHLFSLSELLELNSGTLLPSLQHIRSDFIMHIKVDCVYCRRKGYNCTLCHSEEIIFRFDSHCVLCSRCQTVYHRACLHQDVVCPKCRKRQSRVA